MAPATVIVGPKGRVVIPAALRRALDITEGSEVILLPDGPGRLTLTTRQALHAEVWNAAGPAVRDAATELGALRTPLAPTDDGQAGQPR